MLWNVCMTYRTVETQFETYVLAFYRKWWVSESCLSFNILIKVAQGTQLVCTSLLLLKVRSESALAWSSAIWDLTLNADLMIESAHWKISLWRFDIAHPVTVRGDTRVVFGLFYKSMSFLEMYSIRCQQSILSIQVWHHFPHRNTFIVYSLIGVQSFWMRN